MSIDYDFSRQLKVSGMGEEAQQKLKNARILVIGAGGLGATALPYLAAAGVGHITIVDDDRIEASNLHRQIPFTYEDIDHYKAEIAAKFCQQRSPYGHFSAVCHRLTAKALLTSLREHDLVLDCSDDRRLAYQLSDAALIAQKPVIFANAARLDGQLFNMQPSDSTPCWRCLWPEDVLPGGDCNTIGVLGPAPATLGAWQALSAIKLIVGMPVNHHELLYYDFAHMRQQVLQITKQPTCEHQLNEQTYLQRHMTNYIYPNTLDEAKAEGMTIIDIREPHEWAMRPLPQADAEIAMATLLDAPAQYLVEDQTYLLVCAAGVRSKQAAALLQQQGLDNVFAFPTAW